MIIYFVKETPPLVNKSKPFRFSLKSLDRNFKNYLFILVLFTLGNSSDAFLLYRVEESIRQSGTVVQFVNTIKPLHDFISAFGLYNFAIGLAALPASVIFGAIYSIVNVKYPGLGGTAAFSMGGFLALIAMLLLTFFVRETRWNEKI